MTDLALARAIAAATSLTAPCTHRRNHMKLDVIGGCEHHHGCHVTICDDDTGHLIVGHVAERRAVAALHAYGRSLGYDTGWMGADLYEATVPLSWRWLALDEEAADPDALWSGTWCDRDVPGAVPVTVWLP